MSEISQKIGTELDLNKVKEEVKKLLDKYELYKKSDKLKKLSEEETKKDFILPLFRHLGWDTENSFEVSAEEFISGGKADYGFRIDEMPQFFVEAKSFKVGVENDEDAFQAINYSYGKDCTWAILTNFEKIRLFNAKVKQKFASRSQYLSLDYSEFLNDFDQLLLFSRPSMKLKLLDKVLEKTGKQIVKVPIDKQLLNDMTYFREILSKDISRSNQDKDISTIDLDESVQKILDRLIFIRTVEDRGIEPPLLKPLAIENQEGKLYKKINELTENFREVYDSGLFLPHYCEKLVLRDNSLEKVIKGLHETADETVRYNFADIDADVLGAMYEQYLGHILKKTQKSASIKNGSDKRKEQGIYYTPKYVVDYIVENTVKRYSKENPYVLNKIKIIDPACGSGSFLLGALNYFISKDPDIDKKEMIKEKVYGKGSLSTERFNYMKDMLHGVDLDPKAVEITKLNLLLRATEKKEKLPILKKNIRLGNSLITKEKYADEFFDWKTRFSEIFGNNGFHVVIGNPPYFSIQTIEDKKYKNGLEEEFSEIYTGQNDILYFFYALGTKLLREGGYLGLITSRYFLEADFADNLRKFLKKNTELIQIIDFGSKVRIFQEASINSCILIFRNVKNKNQDNTVHIVKVKDWNESNERLFKFIKKNIDKTIKTKQIEILQKPQKAISEHKWTLQSEETQSIIEKLWKNSKPFGDYEDKSGVCKVFKSIESGLDTLKEDDKYIEVFRISKNTAEKKNLEKKILRPLIKNGMIRRYQINYDDEFLIFTLDDTEIDDYPNVRKHLEEFENELRERYDFKKGNFEWWRLSNLRNINSLLLKQDKLFVSMIAPENRFVYIKSDDYICCADVYVSILQDKNFNLRYVQGVLNSKLMNFLVKRNAKALDGAAKTANGETKRRFSYSVKNTSNLPIKLASKEDQETVVKLVEKIEKLYDDLKSFKDKETDEKGRLEEKITQVDEQIDSLVNKIYQVSQEDLDELET